jgi:hypothetical protein
MKTRIAKTTTPEAADPCRVTSTTGRSGNISRERVKIEGWMQAATRSHSVADMADATGIPKSKVRSIMQAMVQDGKAINTQPGHGKTAHYILSSRKHLAQRTRRMNGNGSGHGRVTNATTSGSYDGRELRPFEGRPGAMDAFALPSMGMGG